MTSTPDHDDAQSEVGRSEFNAAVLVVGLTIAIASLAVYVVVSSPSPWTGRIDSPWWMPALIIAGMALAERFTFHVEYRKHGIAFTLSEVPVVFALLFMGVGWAVIGRMGVGLAVMLWTSRQRPIKIIFNGVLFAFEFALAYQLVSMVADESVSVLLLAAAGAALVASVAGALCVYLAIACFENGFRRRLTELPVTVGTTAVSSFIALVTVAPALIQVEFAFFSAIPAAVLWSVLVQHGRLTQRHRDLAAVHGFTGAIARSLDLDELVDVALDEMRNVLRADVAGVVLYESPRFSSREWHSGPDPADGPFAMLWKRWQSTGDVERASLVDCGSSGSMHVFEVGEAGAMVAPLRGGSDILGRVVVAGRRGITDLYDCDDLERFAAMAAQFGPALSNSIAHARLEYSALHDALTGEWNRAAFEELTQEALVAERSGRRAAALMIDLDKFKDVNDTLGHHIGDRVLIEFTKRVRSLLRHGDVFARFGGDEFALYVERDDVNEVRQLADCILADSYQAITVDGYDIVITSSIGIALASDHDVDANSLLRRADIAMYTAKARRAGCEVYREDIDRRTPERLSLLGDLRRALDEEALVVHYQPKVDLETSKVVGAEALVRWNHPQRGLISPDDFIPLAEESGLIRLLTDQVLTTTLGTLRQWNAHGLDLNVSVNLSTLDLLDELVADRVADRLDQAGISPHQLTLEITESSLMVETPRVMASIRQLDLLGVGLALDDFGTGFSSLSYLRRLPVSELKIDRSFVANLLLDAMDEVIVKSTIDLGHNLNLQVVAEGIENGPIFERLHELGCDLGQGFGISRALPADKFAKWLTNSEYRPVRQR